MKIGALGIALLLAPILAGQTPLASGVSTPISVGGTYDCFGAFGCAVFGGTYTITVPAGAPQMNVVLSNAAGRPMTVYGRLGSAPALVNGQIVNDFSTSDSLTVSPPTLAAGVYYFRPAVHIGIGLNQSVSASADLTVTIMNCSYTLGSSSATAPASGTNGSVTINTLSSCPWTAASNSPFLSVTSSPSGTGPATVQYSVAVNTAQQQRIGTCQCQIEMS
ncbi:MAG: hypothetical protein ABI811_08835 [Acidobacteriota bacterium]